MIKTSSPNKTTYQKLPSVYLHYAWNEEERKGVIDVLWKEKLCLV
jgi:hypothetical protein